ncbi:MAG: hypothetical protein L0229_09510 [Blastocatellia bacterium]|nr:hypothetical protein [Blastocatellia bacterium]
MAEQVKSLWPTQIRPHILSPITILKAQAEALVRQTGGILLADIKRKEIEGEKVELAFEIVVPVLDGYRQRILNVAHDKDLPYPCIVDAEVFKNSDREQFRNFLEGGLKFSFGDANKTESVEFTSPIIKAGRLSRLQVANKADSDVEFTDIIAKVLQSPQVLSTAQSLIARASEALAENEQPVQTLDNELLELPPADSTDELSEGENLVEESE